MSYTPDLSDVFVQGGIPSTVALDLEQRVSQNTALGTSAARSRFKQSFGSVITPIVEQAWGRGLDRPYALATWGDSRANMTAGAFNDPGLTAAGAGESFDPTKAPSQMQTFLGDCEFVANYGVSGDTVLTVAANTGWNNPTRINSKTLVDFTARSIDGVHIQYGVNDINNATTTTAAQRDSVAAATIAGLQAFIMWLVGQGKVFVYETIYPCQDSTSPGWANNGTLKQQCADIVNAAVVAWVRANYVPYGIGAVADSAAVLKQADGFANTAYYLSATNIHLNIVGARLVAPICAAAWRSLLPARRATYFTPTGLQAPNLIPVGSGLLVGGTDSGGGTGTSTTPVWGVDPLSGESYVEFSFVPTVLNGSSIYRYRLQIHAPVGAFSPGGNWYTINVSDVLAASCRLVLDDGAGGTPNVGQIDVRQRLYKQAGGSLFTDWGGIGGTILPITSKVDGRYNPPKMTSDVASSGIEPPATDKGYALVILIETQTLTLPTRGRVYSPFLGKVA